MVEIKYLEDQKEPIDIVPLLAELNLPTRFIHILKRQTFYSKETFYQKVESLEQEYMSYYLFPNQYVAFYPQIKERCAQTNLVCHLSGGVIKKGSFYCSYSPFVESLKTGRVYTISKRICTELGYRDYMPHNISTYEEWYYKLKNCYYQDNNSEIDFYLLSCQLGDTCLDLHMLGKSKKKIKQFVM